MPAKAKIRAKGRLHRAFCENVKARRQHLGLTQQQVADTMGIPQSAYAAMENGDAAPTLTTVERIAVVLKITPALLLATLELAVA